LGAERGYDRVGWICDRPLSGVKGRRADIPRRAGIDPINPYGRGHSKRLGRMGIGFHAAGRSVIWRARGESVLTTTDLGQGAMGEVTAESFICGICGKSHEGLPRDFGWTLPDDVWVIPEDERQERAKFTSDLCQYGDRFFIRSLMKTPILGADDYFGWGIWVEVEKASFDRYLALYDKDGLAWISQT
jgi:hypothetical protein